MPSRRRPTRSARALFVQALEPRRHFCGLHLDPDDPVAEPLTPTDALIERAEARLAGETGPSILWLNRGIGDNFDSVFGGAAERARGVIDAVIEQWRRTIHAFHFPGGEETFYFTVRMAESGTGFGAFARFAVMVDEGKPRDGVIVIGRGNDTNGDGRGDGAGWFVDPTPEDHSEFAGGIVNAFAGDATPGGPAQNAADLYTVMALESTHSMGLTGDPMLSLHSTPGLLRYSGIPDTAEGGGRGQFVAFEGPSVRRLLTTFDSGFGDFGLAVHSAGPSAPVTIGGTVYRGAEDAGNAVYELGRRYLIPDTVALMLGDAFGYTVAAAQTRPTFHAMLDASTGRLLIRGGSGADAIELTQVGASLRVSVDLGADVPGTGALPGAGDLPAYVRSFDLAGITAIDVRGGEGDDRVVLAASPDLLVNIDGGAGEDAIEARGDAALGAVTGVESLHVAGGTLRLAGAAPPTVVRAALVSPPGRLDLGGRTLVIDYAATSPADAMRAWIALAFDHGTWGGAGVLSSNADALTGVASVESADLFGGGGVLDGVAIDATALIVRAAAYGDADLDAAVDIDDLGRMAIAWQGAGGWANGDFSYDGAVGIGDLGLLATNWGGSSESLREAMLRFDAFRGLLRRGGGRVISLLDG